MAAVFHSVIDKRFLTGFCISRLSHLDLVHDAAPVTSNGIKILCSRACSLPQNFWQQNIFRVWGFDWSCGWNAMVVQAQRLAKEDIHGNSAKHGNESPGIPAESRLVMIWLPSLQPAAILECRATGLDARCHAHQFMSDLFSGTGIWYKEWSWKEFLSCAHLGCYYI